MADQFLDGHAGVQVASAESLGKVWTQLIQYVSLRERMGTAAHEIAERTRGAAHRTLDRIAPLIDRPVTGIPA
jgi:3-deoxy-D-manno-octulosonic-acid transferase